MDKVFRAIGRFFKKIWEWIKTTAWVQPLLIVAIIFGIIFSINPIVNAIKGAINSDDTGEFYKKHYVNFNDLFGDIEKQSPEYNKKDASKFKLNDKSGDVLVIYVSDYTLESSVASFYKTSEAEKCTLYVVNFSTDENKKSKYDEDEKKYVDDSGAIYYNYLFDQFMDAYDDPSKGSWRTDYAQKFYETYKYDVFYPSWKTNNNNYQFNGTEESNAVNNVHLPAAVKYSNGKIVDMRFATSNQWVSYNSSDSSYSDFQILADLWKGPSK